MFIAPVVRAADDPKPVKVYILSGQSNMVGIGQVTGGGSRWGAEFLDPVVSVYAGAYDSNADYDKLEPTKTMKLSSFGGVRPTPYPGGGTQVVRGFLRIKSTGVYELRPGYGGSTHNIMEVDGREVYRKIPGQDAKHTPIKLAASKRVPFKITYLTEQANGLGWMPASTFPARWRPSSNRMASSPTSSIATASGSSGTTSGTRAWSLPVPTNG